MGRTASAFQLIRCPACNSLRSVTSRHARRNPGRCRGCTKEDDSRGKYTSFWLKRFTDEEICFMAEAVFDCPEGSASQALVASARTRVTNP